MDINDFQLFEKGHAKDAFLRVYLKKFTLSKKALDKIGGMRFSVYLPKERENAVILIKKDENGRTASKDIKSCYSVSGETKMPPGRYFYKEEFEGGYLFKL